MTRCNTAGTHSCEIPLARVEEEDLPGVATEDARRTDGVEAGGDTLQAVVRVEPACGHINYIQKGGELEFKMRVDIEKLIV